MQCRKVGEKCASQEREQSVESNPILQKVAVTTSKPAQVTQMMQDLMNGENIDKELIVAEFQRLNNLILEQEKEQKLT